MWVSQPPANSSGGSSPEIHLSTTFHGRSISLAAQLSTSCYGLHPSPSSPHLCPFISCAMLPPALCCAAEKDFVRHDSGFGEEVSVEVSGVLEDEGEAAGPPGEAGGQFPGFVFLAGIGKGLGRLWPFLRDKRLKKLVEEADANPMDAAKQSALLAEMTKSRFDSSSCLCIVCICLVWCFLALSFWLQSRICYTTFWTAWSCCW